MSQQARNPNHIYGPLSDAIEGKDAATRSRTKARALAAHGCHTFERRGISVSIDEIREAGGNLFVRASATRDGVALAVDNPITFVNPPVLAPVEPGAASHREDTLEALREIVTQVIELQNS